MATLNVKESYEGKDAFPSKISTKVERLVYPEKNFKCWASNQKVKVIILFMNEEQKIYFAEHEMENKYVKNLHDNGKECQSYDRFHPDSLVWNTIADRFRKPPKQIHRKNADVRMSFRLRNQYLVKAFFTFGLKRVEPGTVHLIQTSAVPILFYLLPREDSRRSLKFEDKKFYFQSIHRFDRRILLEHGAYKIPEGAAYMLFTIQKTFFSLDILKNDFEIPFRVSDPVINRITALKRTIDIPPQTPFIDDDEDDNDDCVDMPPPPSRPAKQARTEEEKDFAEFMIMGPSEPCTFASFPDTSVVSQQQQQQQIDLPNGTRDITLWVLPNPPILERKAVEVSVNFAKNYQILNSKTRDDPKAAVFTEDFPDSEILDLSKKYGDYRHAENSPTSPEVVNLTSPKNTEPESSNAGQSLEDAREENADDTLSENLNAGDGSEEFINFEGADDPGKDEWADLGMSGINFEEILGMNLDDSTIEFEMQNLIAQFNSPPV